VHPTITEGLIKLLKDKQGDEFRSFLKVHNLTQKWIISADFCFHKSFHNRTYAFTIMPVVLPFDAFLEKIKTAIPKDIKKIKVVSEAAVTLINDENLFHFAFVVNDPITVFSDAAPDPAPYILDTVQQLHKGMTGAEMSKELSKPFRLLREEAKAKGFDQSAYCELMIFSALLAGLMVTIGNNTALNLIGVFPDRDTLTIKHEGIYIELARQSANAHFKQHHGKDMHFEVGRGIPNEHGKHMWYDELIRLPDYVAGLISQWDMETLPNLEAKTAPLFYDSYVDSKNMLVFNLRHQEQLYIDLIIAKKT